MNFNLNIAGRPDSSVDGVIINSSLKWGKHFNNLPNDILHYPLHTPLTYPYDLLMRRMEWICMYGRIYVSINGIHPSPPPK